MAQRKARNCCSMETQEETATLGGWLPQTINCTLPPSMVNRGFFGAIGIIQGLFYPEISYQNHLKSTFVGKVRS